MYYDEKKKLYLKEIGDFNHLHVNVETIND